MGTLITYTGKTTTGIQRLGRHEFDPPVVPGMTVEVDDALAARVAASGQGDWEIAADKPKPKAKAKAKANTEETDDT